MVKLGARVRDKVNGAEGIVTARCEYLYGSTSCWVCPDGAKIGEANWCDESRLEMVEPAEAPAAE